MKYSIGDLIIEISSESRMIVISQNTYSIKVILYLNSNPPVELTWKRKDSDKLIQEKLWKHYPIVK
jgi:hypothetical protein